MEYTVERLIREISDGFGLSYAPGDDYLVSEYNMLLRSLALLEGGYDSVESATPSDGKLEFSLAPCQVKRVFCGENELLRASRALLGILPDSRLYCPCDDGIYVTVSGECTVYYKSIPEAVSVADMANVTVPLDARHIPLVRAWLWHRAYLYIGDFESADAFGTEYNRLLDCYKAEREEIK